MKNIKDENINERIERVTKSVAAKKRDMAIWEHEATKKKNNTKRHY